MTNIFYIGIGGIGMSALALYHKKIGMNVSGYDRSRSEITDRLEREGIAVYFDADPSILPEKTENTIIIFSKAIPHGHPLLRAAREKGYAVLSRSSALGELVLEGNCIAVAGTHGKSTVTALIAHILTISGEGCTAFIGAESRNYDSNLLLGSFDNMVVEADEYGRSFLDLYPDMAVITGVDADHLDVYGDLEGVIQAFKTFARQVSGTLIVKEGSPIKIDDTRAWLLTYSLSSKTADFYAKGIRSYRNGYYSFDFVYPAGEIQDIRLEVPGLMNVENCVAAAAMAMVFGISPEEIRSALQSYKGLKRRLDVLLDSPEVAYVDDYAHHPTEIASSLSSVRGMYPGRKITVVFQPHLYSRTRDHASEFAKALSLADELIILDIYPAREDPIPGVDSMMILKDVLCPKKMFVRRDGLLDILPGKDIDVLVTMGAGDISGLVGPLTELLRDRNTLKIFRR